ncbi:MULTISPECIES: hypothetical protein [Shewanella]|nr:MULTISPECIES: hypothetical protein [Shewanella]
MMEVLREIEKELSLGDMIYFLLCLGVCGIVLFNGWESLLSMLASGLR